MLYLYTRTVDNLLNLILCSKFESIILYDTWLISIHTGQKSTMLAQCIATPSIIHYYRVFDRTVVVEPR